MVEVDEEGAARYRFYLAGTASCALEFGPLRAAMPDGATALHAGSLALAMEPIAKTATNKIVVPVRMTNKLPVFK